MKEATVDPRHHVVVGILRRKTLPPIAMIAGGMDLMDKGAADRLAADLNENLGPHDKYVVVDLDPENTGVCNLPQP